MHAYHTASYNLLVSKNLKNFPLSIINSKKKKKLCRHSTGSPTNTTGGII